MVQILSTEEFVSEVRGWAGKIPEGARRILAVAGAPGSGKSTLAAHLVETLNEEEPGMAAILPLDGFHLDDEVLEPRGDRPRKGAPHTFDVGGFGAALERLRANAEAEVAVPRFDRKLEIARAGARIIPRETRLIVVEGNYLLLGHAPWGAFHRRYNYTAFIDVPLPELERRLRERWVGFGMSEAEIAEKLEGNDLPNARTVIEESVLADYNVTP